MSISSRIKIIVYFLTRAFIRYVLFCGVPELRELCGWNIRTKLGNIPVLYLSFWNLRSYWGILVHKLLNGHLPNGYGGDELFKLPTRFVSRDDGGIESIELCKLPRGDVFGHRVECLHKLRCGHLPVRHRVCRMCPVHAR